MQAAHSDRQPEPVKLPRSVGAALAIELRHLRYLTRVLRAVAPSFEFSDPPLRHSLQMNLAFAATADRPTAVLTGPSVIAGSRSRLVRLPRPAVAHEMVRVGLEHRSLAATAALVWSGDLPRTLQQILFDTAESITSPGPVQQVEPELKAAVEVDHVDHEALVAVPLLSTEIVGECRFIRLPDQPGTAEVGVTVVDAWQGRGLGSALLARLSEHALQAGIEYFTAEVLAENRTMLALLPSLGQVETESHGPVVTTRVELAEPSRQAHPDLLDLLTAAARGDIVSLPVLLRRLIRVPEGLTHIVWLPVSTVLKTWRPGPRTPDVPDNP